MQTDFAKRFKEARDDDLPATDSLIERRKKLPPAGIVEMDVPLEKIDRSDMERAVLRGIEVAAEFVSLRFVFACEVQVARKLFEECVDCIDILTDVKLIQIGGSIDDVAKKGEFDICFFVPEDFLEDELDEWPSKRVLN